MASKIYNRPPVQVNTPSAKSVENYFFNHHNWKGVNRTDNFLSVDQETFYDSKNIYVNGEGLLCSRPPIKTYKRFGDMITNIWCFDDVVVVQKNRVLFFYNINGDLYSQTNINSDNVKLVSVEGKLFIFTWADFKFFDFKTHLVREAKDFIYVPKTTFDAAGVETDVEEKNILTDKEIYVYLYNRDAGISTNAYGKELSVKIQDKDYNVIFSEETKDVIADIRFNLSNDFSFTEDSLIVSNKNSYALYSKTSRTISYSPTGNVFTDVFYIDDSMGNLIAPPKFSKNGLYIIIATNVSIYIVSVLSEDVTSGGLPFKRFENFTDLYDFNDVDISKLNWSNIKNVVYDFADWSEFAIFVERYDGSNDLFKHSVGKNYEIKNIVGYADNGLNITPLSISYNNSSNVIYDNRKVVISLFCSENGKDSWYCFGENLDTLISDYVYGSNVYFGETVVLTDKIIVISGSNVFIPGDYNGLRYFEHDGSKYRYKTIDENAKSLGILSSDGNKILTEDGVYFLQTNMYYKLLVAPSMVVPIGFTDYIHYIGVDTDRNRCDVYSSLTDRSYEFLYEKEGNHHLTYIDHVSFLNEFYISKDNILYISEHREDADGNFLWYFPKHNKHVFETRVNNLRPISTSEMCVFLENEIWYVGKSELGYVAIKSKFESGVKNNSDVISSEDGSYTMFCTNSGFVALRYQDFVASTDQVLTTLSEPIYQQMVDYVKDPVKLFKHDFWTLLYKQSSGDGFIFDRRNNSWWPVSYDKNVNKIVQIKDDIILLCDGNLYFIDKNYDKYADDGKVIDWYLLSQKLYLGANNYYKHIINMTLSSVVGDRNPEELLTYDLDIINYRKQVDDDVKTIAYKAEVMRTFIQRLNYFKINAFQYRLKTDHNNKVQTPLSLADITIKYKITGQVR